jgi:hypothetical protein
MATELLIGTLPPDHVRVTAIASITAMADLVREAITPQALKRAVTEAQALAHQAATEGN